MDFDELMKKVDELRAQGMDDEDVLNIFYEAYKEDEMPLEDLEKCVKAIGYKFSDAFVSEIENAKKEAESQVPVEEAENEDESKDGLTEKEVDEVKEIDPSETKEEFKEKIDDINEGKGVKEESKEPEEESEEEPEEEESEEDEKEKAMKMFGLR